MVFDGQALDLYGLYLADTKTGIEEYDLGANYKINSDSVKNNIYTFGIEEDGVLEFELCLMRDYPLNQYDISEISRLLFDHKTYKKLQLITDDMEDRYVMCKLNSPKKIVFGNMCYGFRFTVVCDGQYWYENENTIGLTSGESINIYNDCDTNNTVDTRVTIKSNDTGDIKIINATTGKEVVITSAKQGEIIEMNSRLQTIKSSMFSYTYDRFNFEWLTLAKGYNTIAVIGNADVTICYRFMRRG